MIDAMATEGLWVSPGRSINDLAKSSPFRKTEQGKFEAK